MKITKIEEQKNRKDRFNIYVNDEFVTGASGDVIIKCNLFKDKELTNEDLVNILAEEEYTKCLSRAYDLISRRMQSCLEIKTKLRGKFSNSTIEKVIHRLEELDYVDDSKFANLWVQNRKAFCGANKLKFELVKKGIAKEIIDELILEEKQDKDSQFSVALSLAKKKFKSEWSKDEKLTKLGGFLTRRGFDYEIIKKVLSEIN